MNGVKFLLDSCFIIGWYARKDIAFDLIKQHDLQFESCAYSVISYAKVIDFGHISEQDEHNLRMLFGRLGGRLALTDNIIETTITLRKNHKMKLPDALILATANSYNLQLITFDEKLQRIFNQITQTN
ncbi:MAG: PIN domain-containing protein [Moraxella sp.]|nr:PIN domain-containing protein [Moraxella sp.]